MKNLEANKKMSETPKKKKKKKEREGKEAQTIGKKGGQKGK